MDMEEYSWSLKCCITLIHRKMFIINQYASFTSPFIECT